MRSFDEWFDENCDGSDLAKDACRKLWNEFSDQINIICRKSYEKQQSKIDELNCDINVQKEQLNKLDRVIDGYAIEVDELQKKNSWLSDVAERENKRANKLQEEKVSTTTLLGKTIQEKNELQKRVDAAIYLLPSLKAENDLWGCDQVERQIELLEQALKGG